MKKLLFLTLVLTATICCYADKYKIIELNPSPIQIGKKNLKVGDTFDETSVITWTSSKQYMRAENLTTHNLRKYSSSAMTAKGANSISSYRMKVKKLSGRNVESDEPFRLSGKNKSRFAEKRIALVMGNSEYDNINYLENAVYDATQIADNLQELGFDVIACYDAQIGEMKRALRIFGNEALSGKYDVAVFYYAGHGVQNRTDGHSYMLPVDIDMDNSYINVRSCLAALDIRDEIQMAECKVNILIFDACRTNMYMRELSSAAFSMEPGKNTVVMFSTSNGEQTMDKYKGCVNGPFATALMNGINQPGHEVTIMLNDVKRQVYEITDHLQIPSISSNLVEQFYFTNPTHTNNLGYNDVTDDNHRLEQAIIDYKEYNYAEAYLVFRELANGGNAEAQFYLGKCYDDGYIVPKSIDEAVKWYRKAAMQGFPKAQINLGECYRYGIGGVQESIDEAAEWYRKAAEQGDADGQFQLGRYYDNIFGNLRQNHKAAKWHRMAAEQGHAVSQYNLGNFYYSGRGVLKSYKKAVKWYHRAAKQGIGKAQYYLGVCYENGKGVQQSDYEAAEWFRQAAEQGNAFAQVNLGYYYEKGKGVPQSYDEAEKWYRKAAEQGIAEAIYIRINVYDNGYGVKQSFDEIVKWYSKAAEQGDAQAQFHLGICYLLGCGVERSYDEAVKWFCKAAEQGDVNAQYILGNCYLDKYITKQSDTEAVKWFRKAAEQGDASAQNSLGSCYILGKGIEQSDTEAVKWYRKAVEQGDATAQYNLGVCYRYGQGVPPSDTEAVKWYRKAAEQGVAQAQYILGRCYEYGRIDPPSIDEAIKWYRKATKNGYTEAKNKLKEIAIEKLKELSK